ncbi:hypothetical protein J8G26_07195 [Acidovorax sp. JG5]|uniref:hypothetical protein n=1 Tax=Acidovorax sp. JG5 TaxID=2822718 RepID=UPI001B33D25E|nr:hypothetical protein [Acidovorax sp. JG5]MBP3980519.1 hypothetical protein [Acidovorax sp. JG5]
MKSRTQTCSPSHLIALAEIATAIAIARGTAGLEELHWLAQQAANGFLTAHLYPPHQPWQNGNITNSDGKQAHNSAGISRYGKPASNPAGIWRTLGKKAMLAYRGDKDAFNYPPAASTWHMLAADVYEIAQQPMWSAIAAAALRDIACRYSPELMGERATPAPQQPAPAAVEALPAQPQAAAPAPVVAESADDGEAWKAMARERAGEIIKRQREKDLHPSQEAIADEIAREFRQACIVGAGGKPLTGAYIKRHALKGISSAQNRQLSTSIRRGK